ncbi:TPR repeat-containing protein [Caballeronia peredens]|nr:TPR repeat-containing protein [Caballeronia peredens]
MKAMSTSFNTRLAAVLVCAMLGACASKPERGYGAAAQAEREAALERTSREGALPDSPGMYLALIDKMQSEGMYYASLAHIDAYEKRYGRSPDSTLRRADALRKTEQTDASRTAYDSLLSTPLAARGHRGLGLLAGEAGDFDEAARQFAQASDLDPTDAPILSDLGYALLRMGNIDAARVPLMKASELARNNPKIQKNLVLYLLASAQGEAAREIVAQQQFSAETQQAIQKNLKLVLDAAKIKGDMSRAAVASMARAM